MTVLVALEGRQALAIGEKITPDIILLDAIMPSIDGFETCRRIKRDKALAHVPVIFMTGLSETHDIVKGLEAGGVDYVTKPIVPDELLARIRVHLANARLAHSARAAHDASGRHLLATTASGRVLWSTPQAARLLERAFSDFHGEGSVLPAGVQNWLERRTRTNASSTADEITLDTNASGLKLRLSYVGQLAPDEVLLRLIEGVVTHDPGVGGANVDRPRQVEPRYRGNPEAEPADRQQAPRTDFRQAGRGEPRLSRRPGGTYTWGGVNSATLPACSHLPLLSRRFVQLAAPRCR
jgi:DNA-binding response OmpR family regulator